MKYFSTVPKVYGAVQWNGDNIDEINELVPESYRRFNNGELIVVTAIPQVVFSGEWVLFSPYHGAQVLETHPSTYNFQEIPPENPHVVPTQVSV